MNLVKRIMYHSMIGSFKVYRRLFLDLHVWGREHIPPGAKIYVSNHITSTDPYWVLPVFTEPVHVIIGPGYQSRLTSWLLDHFEQINAMPEHRTTVVDNAVKYLERGEPVYSAPEGDLQETFRLGHFYPGVARIYRRFQAPIIPIALHAPRVNMKEFSQKIVVDGREYRTLMLFRGPYCINIGEPFTPQVGDGDPRIEEERIMAELKERIRLLVEDVRVNKFWM